MQSILSSICIAGLVCCGATAIAAETAGMPNPFFAMDTGTKDENHQTPQAQASMLKELGYAGYGFTGFKEIPAMLHALDANNLKMFTTYISATVEPDGGTLEPGLEEGITALKGRNTILWLTINSKTYKPSSTDGDAIAVKMLCDISDKLQQTSLRVALYPHTGCWLEKVEDAVRVAKLVDRKNVGVTFNLCHWLNAGKGQNMNGLLDLARPYLFVVTINGADTEGGWDRLIQTLDKGSFDLRGFLQGLRRIEYTGPIGLQGYGIKGDVHENLKRSITAWHKLSKGR
ncbi:MAG TPA: TIM barrel protein [Candidatus Hydrogenedentes bacterium]|nr:TIM barrel protein [Candidatus Hydrogenedentota bacterium]